MSKEVNGSVPWSSDVTWDKPPTRSVSIQVVDGMSPGETKRIFHPELACDGTPRGCTLARYIRSKNYTSNKYEYYHEDENLMVVRRI